MSIKKTKYLLVQTFQSIFRNRFMSLASISAVMAVLILLGYVVLIMLNINNIAMITTEEFDEIAIYINEDVTDSEIVELGETLEAMDGVMTVVYLPKEDALELEKLKWGEQAYLLEGLRTNPLPNTYLIQLENVDYSDNVLPKISEMEEVEDYRYYQDTVESLIAISQTIRNIGIVVIGALLLLTVFIISNTIKITVIFRRKEIELMQYLGATNGYVRTPFVIEGIILGLIGAGLAIAVIFLSYNNLTEYVTNYLLSGFSTYVINLNVVFTDIVIIFITIGVGIGTLGSLISLKKFLSV